MSTSSRTGVRHLGLVLAMVLALAPQLIGSGTAGAQPALALNKAVCNVTTGGACLTTTTSTSVNASAGNVVQYNLNYTNNQLVPATITLTDTLQPGQTFLSCSAPFTPPPASFTTCTPTSSAPMITAVIMGVPAGASGTIAIQVSITGTSGSVSNSFNGTSNSLAGTVTAGPSNITTVTVAGGSSSPCLVVIKDLANLNAPEGNGQYSTGAFAYTGNTIRYRIMVSNGCGAIVGGVTLSDFIQPGQSFLGNCNPGNCSWNGATLTFPVGDLVPGAAATVTFDVRVAGCCSATIPNFAQATSTNTPTSTSNATIITLLGALVGPPVYTPPPYGGPFFGTVTLCGVVTGFNMASSSSGFIIINGMDFALMPYIVPSGTTIVVGTTYCITFTLNGAGQVSSMLVGPNVAAVNYACGTLSPFTAGFNPYPGFHPYPGYNPYPGYGQYPGYGPYPYTGYPGMYGYSGPVVLSGYPFPVQNGTYFPFYPQYGNPYCFLMNGPYLNGSLSVVPTAASPAEEGSAVHRSGRTFTL